MQNKKIKIHKKISIENLQYMNVGDIVEICCSELPQCFIQCNGQLLKTEHFPELFNVLEYTYGGKTGFFKIPKRKNCIIKYTKYKN